MGHAPIAKAISMWHTMLLSTMDQGQHWLEGLRKAAAKWKRLCNIGSMFSGSDIICRISMMCSMYWSYTYDIILSFQLEFAAGKAEKKQMFLKKHGNMLLLFNDGKGLAKTMATILLDGELALVPEVNWLIHLDKPRLKCKVEVQGVHFTRRRGDRRRL